MFTTTVGDKVMARTRAGGGDRRGTGCDGVGAPALSARRNFTAETVSVWLLGVGTATARDLTAGSAGITRSHVLIGLALFALWPFTRLVHAFAPRSAIISPIFHLPQPRGRANAARQRRW